MTTKKKTKQAQRVEGENMKIPDEDLRDVMTEYDKYIQDANNEDRYSNGWRPVCIQEFYENDYLELLREG